MEITRKGFFASLLSGISGALLGYKGRDMATDYRDTPIQMTPHDRGGGAHNVQAYGAQGAGGDDTSGLQTAITRAKASGSREVVLPPGVYGLTAPLVASIWGDEAHGLTIRGLGTHDEHNGSGVIIRALAPMEVMLRATGRSMRGLHFEGVTFDADGLAQDCVWVAPEVGYSAWGVTFERCWFQDYTRYGLRRGDLVAFDDGSGMARDYTGQFAGCSGRDVIFQSYQDNAIALRGDSSGAGTTEDWNWFNLQCLNASAAKTTAHISIGAGFKENFFGLVSTGVKDDPAAFAIDTKSPVRVYGWTTEDPRLLNTYPQGYDADVILLGVRQGGALPAGAPVAAVRWRGTGVGGNYPHPKLVLEGVQLQGNVHFGATSDIRFIAAGVSFLGTAGYVYDGPTNVSGVITSASGTVTLVTPTKNTLLSPTTVALLSAAQTWTAQQVFERAASGQGAIQVKVTGEANPKIFLATDGRQYFGPGGATGVADYIEYKAANAIGLRAGTAWRLGSGTSASRPDAATVGAGAEWYDTTLGKPIWSNGSVWKDAAGTTV